MLNQLSFQTMVEELAKQEKLDYVDAVLLFCKKYDLEPSDIKSLVSSNLKDKIRGSAIEQGLMKNTGAKLPI